MRFTVAGGKIRCSRIAERLGGHNEYRAVVDFDEHAGIVPQHVKEQLTASETRQLLEFLTEHRREKPARGNNLLASLPEMLLQATEILYTVDHIDGRTYKDVAEALASLNAALEIVRENQLSRK